MTQQKSPRPVAQTREQYAIDPAHTSVEFAVKHMMFSTVTGRFRTVRGTFALDPAAPERSAAEAEVDVASIDTGVADRDAHLRSPDFFDAEKHPTIGFRSLAAKKTTDDSGRLRGDLTIRGVTREVEFVAEFEGEGKDPWGNERVGFTLETTIDRKDFGLTWNALLETGGVLVGDAVKITIRAQGIRAKGS
ncbi:MAG: YceI family protein [Methanobacteriota archaeon]